MTGGGSGRIVESGIDTGGGGIGAALRMTTGIVLSGRADALGSGSTLGIGAELGRGRAVGTVTPVGRGGTATGRGTLLWSGAASVGTATPGRDGTAGAVGVWGVAVQAMGASSAKTTSRRMSNLPTSKRSKSSANPTSLQRKWTVVAVQGARAGLPVRTGLPRLLAMRFALIPPMPIAPMPGLALRSGG
jgi:hypothetical protein